MPVRQYGIYKVVYQEGWDPDKAKPIMDWLKLHFPGKFYEIDFVSRFIGVSGMLFRADTPTWVNLVKDDEIDFAIEHVLDLMDKWVAKVNADPHWASVNYGICPKCQSWMRWIPEVRNEMITHPIYVPAIIPAHYECYCEGRL